MLQKTFDIQEIKVGIPTQGEPRLERAEGGLTRLNNMLIGKDFHWQQCLSVLLPGRVEVIDTDEECKDTDAGFSIINHVPLEIYLQCVVGSEMNPEAPIEFLKSHAVISRSWALGKIFKTHPEDNVGRVETPDCIIGWDDTSSHHSFHVCSDDHCQRYQGIQSISSQAEEALSSTAGIVLTDSKGDVIDARFSKCCGGRTELFSTCWQDRELPGLESFPDSWCDVSHISARALRSVMKEYDLSTGVGYSWTEEVSKAYIARNLKEKFGRSVGKILSLHPIESGPSGRIRLLEVIGEDGSLLLGKELWIRRLLSPSHLYSSAFDIEDKGEKIVLTGRGWGHGVGLCQIGAAHMALEGASFQDILSFYYPGTVLKDIRI